MKEIYYGIGGHLPGTVDENEIFAKSSFKGKKDIYLIRHATSGVCCPHFLNPWGVHWKKGDEHKLDSHTGKRVYEFKEVGKEIFDMYVRFLETQKELYYLQAERIRE